MANGVGRVSIVLPTHNGERYLRGAIESCLGQTHGDLELVVIDDASTDGTPRIIEAVRDPRLTCIRNPRNQGLPRSLNIGFARTTGEYLSWTSDDNEYDLSAIERMLAVLRADRAAQFVFADYTAVDESRGEIGLRELPDEPELAHWNTIGACFLYTRRAYREVGEFDHRVALAEDYEYWIRVWKRFPMRHLPSNLYRYRYHAASLTSTKLFQVEVVKALVKHRHGFLSDGELVDAVYRQVAKAYDELPAGRACAVIADMLRRIRRVSGPLAVRLVLSVSAVRLGRAVGRAVRARR